MSKKVLGGIIAIALIGWFAISYDGRPSNDLEGVPSLTQQTATTTNRTGGATTTKVATSSKKTSSASSASQPVSMSYQSALETYKGSLRLQLSGADFCQASPNTVTYKNGTSIMIDNRSSKARIVRIGTIGTYTIEGYGFRIIKLTSSALPATLLADCDTQQNVAKITIQK